jgi:hypothetical protein
METESSTVSGTITEKEMIEDLAEREGFEPSIQVLARITV